MIGYVLAFAAGVIAGAVLAELLANKVVAEFDIFRAELREKLAKFGI